MPNTQTTGTGVAVNVINDIAAVTLSLSGTHTHQLTTTLTDGVGANKSATASPKYVSRNPYVATVSGSGLITGVNKGQAIVEVSYPTFDNAHGVANDGTYAEKIYQEVLVAVGH